MTSFESLKDIAFSSICLAKSKLKVSLASLNVAAVNSFSELLNFQILISCVFSLSSTKAESTLKSTVIEV
jgi:hypothetical protein